VFGNLMTGKRDTTPRMGYTAWCKPYSLYWRSYHTVDHEMDTKADHLASARPGFETTPGAPHALPRADTSRVPDGHQCPCPGTVGGEG